MIINAIIEKDENGYFAYVSELKGCVSQGDTYEEALNNIKEAASLYIETLDSAEISTIKARNIIIEPIEMQLRA